MAERLVVLTLIKARFALEPRVEANLTITILQTGFDFLRSMSPDRFL